MSLLEEKALSDHVMAAFIARLEERMHGPNYYWDMRGKIFDAFCLPSEVQLPVLRVTMLPEENLETLSSGAEGQYRIRLPILLEWSDAWVEQPSQSSERVRIASRARAEIKRAAAGDMWIDPPGFQATIRFVQGNILVGGADDEVNADVTVYAEYHENVQDPFREV